jgi:hypothetical protein
MIMPASSFFDDGLAASISQEGLPAALLSDHPGKWRALGSGIFTWSVFRVYRATLLAVSPTDEVEPRFDPNQPFALDLHYLRKVAADQIVQASVQEMQRLRNVNRTSLAAWADRLSQIIPDVALGDRLIGLFQPGHGVRFFSGTALLGELAEPAFCDAFAAVWLDPDTKAPTLRAALLGHLPSQAVQA